MWEQLHGTLPGARPWSADAGGDGARVLDGRYRLESVIGRGGMATVHRARDLLLERDVAVKLFPPADQDADELLRHSAEIRLLATLNHPSLVALHDAGAVHDGGGSQQVYLVMELVEGPTLGDRLQRGPLTVGETLLVGRQVAEALALVHEREIVHRDIKPGNILLTVPGHGPLTDGPPGGGSVVKVADFGIARLPGATRLTMTGITLGTVRYLSPEQVSGSALGPSSDIYALGLVLIECLSGQAAFRGTLAEAAAARLTSPPAIPPGLGPDLAGLLARMTALAPDERPTAGEVAAAMTDIRAGLDGADTIVMSEPVTLAIPTAAAPEVGARRRAPSARSRRRVAAVGVGAVLALDGLTVALQHVTGQPEPVAPPSYPAVTGPLGDDLTTLQRSVVP